MSGATMPDDVLLGLDVLAARLTASDRGWMGSMHSMIALYEAGWRFIPDTDRIVPAALLEQAADVIEALLDDRHSPDAEALVAALRAAKGSG
jgi:hypothetical protein